MTLKLKPEKKAEHEKEKRWIKQRRENIIWQKYMLAVVYYMNVVKRCKAFYSGDNQLEKKEEAMQRVHLDIKKQNTIPNC